MTEKKRYADQWEVSSRHFYENDCYDWMAERVEPYKTVLEIGCGTGFGTLELLKHGHKVIAVDKNECCIEQAKNRISMAGYTMGDLLHNDVEFIAADIVDKGFFQSITKSHFDIVICWNVGTYEDNGTRDYYQPFLLEYGLSEQLIDSNWESSYAELIFWTACKIAAFNKVPFHLIERSSEGLTNESSQYYAALGGEFNYQEMKVDQAITTTISSGGKLLKVKGGVVKEREIQTILISILYLYL
jgi:SAM-dependent methyltransferase